MISIKQILKPSKKDGKFKNIFYNAIGYDINNIKAFIFSVVLPDGSIKTTEFSLANGIIYISKKKQLIVELEGSSMVKAKTYTDSDVEEIELNKKGFTMEKDVINLTPKKPVLDFTDHRSSKRKVNKKKKKNKKSRVV